jgi:hypothetical protein
VMAIAHTGELKRTIYKLKHYTENQRLSNTKH